MVLSLLPQTVLALDPDQLAGLAKLVREKVTFEGKTIRLGADIYLLQYEETGKPWWDGIGNATSSTAVFKGTFDGCGHTIDQMLAGSGGVGGVVGQFGDGSIANSYNYGNVTLGEGLVCNNLGGVIGRDMKRSAARVENVYYLDSSCAYASTSGADERVTAVSAASCWPRGQVIPAKGHDYKDGKCTVCGAEDPNYQPEQPTQPENPGVRTGDESYVVPWSAALLLGGAALVLLPRKKRS